MEKTNDQPHHQTPPSSSSSSLPSHDDVCKFLFGYLTSMYPLISKFYATMVAQCPHSGMEEIKKAVHNRNRKQAFKILNRLFEEHTTSGDLHRINAEIYIQANADVDRPLDKHLIAQDLKRGIASATRSVQLAPHNIENHFVLVSLLSLDAHDTQRRKLVIQKCKEALEINDPNEKDAPQGPTSARSKITDILLTHERKRQESIYSVWIPMVLQHYILLSIADFGEYYLHCLEDETSNKVVTEAWDFGISHRSWKFWQCCCCDQKFERSDLLFKHSAETHFTHQAQSAIDTETLEHVIGNHSFSFDNFPIQERIFAQGDLSCLVVAPSCLLNLGTDTSETAFPSRDLSITTLSYRILLSQWTASRETRKRQGAELLKALEKMSEVDCEEEAKSAVTITDVTKGISELTTTEDAQATTQKISSLEKVLERLSADIDSEIRKNGEWILQTEDLHITENPFGEFDYRNVLLPLVQSYIWAWVEEQADKEPPERSDRISLMKNS